MSHCSINCTVPLVVALTHWWLSYLHTLRTVWLKMVLCFFEIKEKNSFRTHNLCCINMAADC